jgi:hypothetical protein
MSQIIIDTPTLIKYMSRCTHTYFHTALRPIDHLVKWDQRLIYGYNCGGRPEGMYLSPGKEWLEFITNPTLNIHESFRQYMYIYAIDFNRDNIIELNTLDDVKRFDETIPDYWISPTYNTACYTSEAFSRNPESIVRIPEIVKKYTDFASGLIAHGVILTNYDEWVKQCAKLSPSPCGEYLWRFKRWDIVAQRAPGIIFSKIYKSYKDLWYSTLSVPSACIWDTSIIKDYGIIASVLTHPHKKQSKYNKHHATADIKSFTWEISELGKELFGL